MLTLKLTLKTNNNCNLITIHKNGSFSDGLEYDVTTPFLYGNPLYTLMAMSDSSRLKPHSVSGTRSRGTGCIFERKSLETPTMLPPLFIPFVLQVVLKITALKREGKFDPNSIPIHLISMVEFAKTFLLKRNLRPSVDYYSLLM